MSLHTTTILALAVVKFYMQGCACDVAVLSNTFTLEILNHHRCVLVEKLNLVFTFFSSAHTTIIYGLTC